MAGVTLLPLLPLRSFHPMFADSQRSSWIRLLLLRAGLVAASVSVVAGCRAVGPPLPPPPAPDDGWMQEGVASWYGEAFHGRPTASGEPFDMEALTAAHPSLPFGTVVHVHNLENGRSVRVRINDRGPFVSERIVDVSRRAARELDMIRSGIARVRLTVAEDSD